jgi:hypothetical protein
MDHRLRGAIDRTAQAGALVFLTTIGGAALAQTSAPNLSIPLAFQPGQGAASSEPARPTASSWSAYAIETHKRIERHLRANRDNFKYRSDLYVEVWVDPNGRVTRTRVTGASGNRAADAQAGPDFPPGLILSAPSKDMPQPIKVKINADR